MFYIYHNHTRVISRVVLKNADEEDKTLVRKVCHRLTWHPGTAHRVGEILGFGSIYLVTVSAVTSGWGRSTRTRQVVDPVKAQTRSDGFLRVAAYNIKQLFLIGAYSFYFDWEVLCDCYG